MSKTNKKKLIILSGGGSGGPVTPLLAIYQELKKDYRFLFVGTSQGPERALVKEAGLDFLTIPAGKWRRYLSFKNIWDLFRISMGFGKSLWLIKKYRPALVMSAGGFVSVPLAYAAYFLRVPVLIHQQDIRPGLANKLMAKVAREVTVTFTKSLKDYGSKAVLTGNPVGKIDLLDPISLREEVMEEYDFTDNRPLLLIIGGGTGSLFINRLVRKNLKELAAIFNIVHIGGHRKYDEARKTSHPNYRFLEFIDHEDVLKIEAASDLVVSRCGLGVLSELVYFKKPAILIPIPGSQQEDNANYFKTRQAALVFFEPEFNSTIFIKTLKKLLADNLLRRELAVKMGSAIKVGTTALAQEIRRIVK